MRRSTAWPVALAILAIGLELCVSANLLTWIGIPYLRAGGTLLEKFHPGTDLLALACAMKIARQGAWPLLVGQPWLAAYLALLAACVCLALVLSGPGNLIVLLETFLPAGLLALVLADARPAWLARLLRLMRWMIALNAALALAEMARHATFVPLYLNDAIYTPLTADFRPTALYDHPLTGGIMSMIGLAIAPSGRWALPAYGGLMLAAMLAFGGRMALLVTLCVLVCQIGGWVGALVLRRDPRAGGALLAVAAATLLAILLLAALLTLGFGSRVLGHLYWDPSAQARLAQWRVLGRLDGWQIMLGTPRAALIAQLTPMTLSSGIDVIENFWLLMFVDLGLIGFPFFLAAFACLAVWCWQRTNARGRWLLLAVLLVASTSNSLGRKSIVLVQLVAALICLARPHACRAMADQGKASTSFLKKSSKKLLSGVTRQAAPVARQQAKVFWFFFTKKNNFLPSHNNPPHRA